MPEGDVVAVTVSVPVSLAQAFELFTRDIDQWWQRGMRFRNGGSGASRMVLEEGEGGGFAELLGEGADVQRVEIGRITAWNPPHAFAMRWRNSNFAPDEHTQLEVSFTDVGRSTHVTVRHQGRAQLRPDHPARHGRQGPDFTRWHGMWWADVLRPFLARCTDANR